MGSNNKKCITQFDIAEAIFPFQNRIKMINVRLGKVDQFPRADQGFLYLFYIGDRGYVGRHNHGIDMILLLWDDDGDLSLCVR